MFLGGESIYFMYQCISDPSNYLVLRKGMKIYTVCTTHASMKNNPQVHKIRHQETLAGEAKL